jgi:hypothetical protein
MNHLKKLKSITGKEFIHNQKHLTIDDYELDEEGIHLQVTIDNAQSKMLIPSSDAHQFFNSLLPVENDQTVNLYQSQQQSLTAMRTQLMELNTKLMGPDSEQYIKQAKAVNNNINTLINSLKLEFQVAKEIRRQNN